MHKHKITSKLNKAHCIDHKLAKTALYSLQHYVIHAKVLMLFTVVTFKYEIMTRTE